MRPATAFVLTLALCGAALPAPRAMAQPMPPPAASVVTQARTVSELAAICDPAWRGVPRLEAIAYCQGFLTSFGQHHALMHPAGGPVRPLFCVPTPGPSVAQSGVAFAAWARDNPRHAEEPALDGLLRWAQANFPCPARPPARGAR